MDKSRSLKNQDYLAEKLSFFFFIHHLQHVYLLKINTAPSHLHVAPQSHIFLCGLTGDGVFIKPFTAGHL